MTALANGNRDLAHVSFRPAAVWPRLSPGVELLRHVQRMSLNWLWSILDTMKTIQVVVEEDLLRAAGREAKRAKVNRSMLFRAALRDYLKRKRIEALEEQHRRAYKRNPEQPGEFGVWDKVLS